MAKNITREEVEDLIREYLKEVGLCANTAYDAERRAWYWQKGSAKIEAFVQPVDMGGYFRYFLRIFSPVIKVPQHNTTGFYRKLLEMNDSKLGVKLSVLPGTDQVYATFERDIKGLDYEELATCIADLEWWADKLDNELAQEFLGEAAPE